MNPSTAWICSPLRKVCLTFEWRTVELWWTSEETILSSVMTANSKSFYILYFPEETSGRLRYLTISSFLTGISECIINVHKNKLAIYCVLYKMMLMHIFMCCSSWHDIVYKPKRTNAFTFTLILHIHNHLCHCQRMMWHTRRGCYTKLCGLHCIKQREVLPYKQIDTYSEHDLWMQAVTGSVPDSMHAAWVWIK